MQPQNTPQNQTQYDFSSLTMPVGAADIAAFKARQPGDDGTGTYWIFGVVAVVFGSVLGMGIAGSIIDKFRQPNETYVLVDVLVWVGMVVAAFYGVGWIRRMRRERLVRLDRFAAANHMQLIHDQSDPGYNGMIFDEGHSRVLNEGLVTQDGTEIGNYTYVTGHGKNQSTHTYGFVRIPLQRALPNMVLDARSNNFLGKISNLPEIFNANQTLSLEGDFDTHFTLYAPKEYERDALYVFTPDVMAKLIDNGNGYDMETVDTWLYIYHSLHFNLTDATKMAELFSIVDTIATELRDQTKRYADERVGDRTLNVIAPQGARLKHGVNWIVVGIVALFVALQFAGPMLSSSGFWVVSLLPPLMVITFIVAAIVSALKRRS